MVLRGFQNQGNIKPLLDSSCRLPNSQHFGFWDPVQSYICVHALFKQLANGISIIDRADFNYGRTTEQMRKEGPHMTEKINLFQKQHEFIIGYRALTGRHCRMVYCKDLKAAFAVPLSFAIALVVVTATNEREASGARFLLPAFPLFVAWALEVPKRFFSSVVASSAVLIGALFFVSVAPYLCTP